jgi:YggT family protein
MFVAGLQTDLQRNTVKFRLHFQGSPMRLLLVGIDVGLELYCWVLFTFLVVHILIGFKIIDIRSRPIAVVNSYLDRATAFPLWPFRKIIPDLGAVDISPMVLILALMWVRYWIALIVWPKFF